jgi:hypothetical protein
MFCYSKAYFEKRSEFMPDQVAEEKLRYCASLRSALLLVEEALDIVDLAGAPDEIGAHLEMARHRLEACLNLEE